MIYALALRLGVPVYELRERMPAREWYGWMRFFSEQNQEPEPPSLEDVGTDGFLAGMGVIRDGS